MKVVRRGAVLMFPFHPPNLVACSTSLAFLLCRHHAMRPASWTASYSSGTVPGFSRITPSLMTSRTSFAIRSAESVFAP